MLALLLVALLAQSPSEASVKIHHKKSHRRHHKPATVPNNRVNPAYVPNLPYYPPMNPYTFPLPHAGVADYTTCTCPTWGHLICDPATQQCTIKCGTQTLCQGQCASQNAKVGLTVTREEMQENKRWNLFPVCTVWTAGENHGAPVCAGLQPQQQDARGEGLQQVSRAGVRRGARSR